jgi:hypothetical protein
LTLDLIIPEARHWERRHKPKPDVEMRFAGRAGQGRSHEVCRALRPELTSGEMRAVRNVHHART